MYLHAIDHDAEVAVVVAAEERGGFQVVGDQSADRVVRRRRRARELGRQRERYGLEPVPTARVRAACH